MTPCAARPSTTVPAAATTASAVPPYCRSNAPTGGLALSVPAGTTSTTGARSRFTPAPSSAAPRRSASPASWSAGSAPWSSADGSGSKPAPCSDCTLPPSWSTATQSPGPGAADCQPSTVVASSVAAVRDRPARKIPPTPLAARSAPSARSSTRRPATNSWATCARRSIPARATPTGSVVAGAALLVAGAEEAVGSPVPPDEQAPSPSSRQPSVARRRAVRMARSLPDASQR